MDIILLETIPKLGRVGDVVKVKDGYARNYLVPRKKALRASAENKAFFEAEKVRLEEQDLKNQKDAGVLADKLANTSIVLIRQAGDSGRLYGSVNARDVAQKLSEKASSFRKDQIKMDPIKELGIFKAYVHLHGETNFPFFINVARSEEEASLQEKSGGALAKEEEDVSEPILEEEK